MGTTRRTAVAILLIALCAGFTGQALSQATPCPASCDVNKLQRVNDTGATTTDIASAVKVTLDTMLDYIGKFAGPEVGGITGSVKGLMDTGFSLWSAWNSVANPQQSIKNSLHNDMVKMEDYLVCEVQSIVGAAQSAIEKDLTQDQLNTFNANIKNAISQLQDSCGALNCLNMTDVVPSQRNARAGTNCVVGKISSACRGVKGTAWDPMNITTCGADDNGVCDPIDGKCYHGFSNDDAITFYQTLNQEFNDGNINNLFGLDQFAADDTEALVLTAKMSLLQITIYQQLIMMGSTQGENTTMMAFAATAADRIGERYKYLTNITRIRGLVDTYSTFKNSTFLQGGIPNPAYPSGWFGGLGYDDASHNTFTVSCNNVGGSYPVGPEGCLLWQLTYGSYQVAYGCDPAKTKPVFQQTENQCYNDHGRQVPGPCSTSWMPYGLDGIRKCWHFNPNDFSLGPFTCRGDSKFQDVWRGQHDTPLAAQFASAKEALAQEVYANLNKTLADVKGIYEDLIQLNKVGMPLDSFDVFATTYPKQSCDAITISAAAATKLSKLSGRPPLPKGAIRNRPAPVAADVASPAPMAAGAASPAPMAAGMAPPAPVAADVASPAPMAAGAASPAPMAAGMAPPAPVAADVASPAPAAAGMAPPAPMTSDVASPAPMAAGMAPPAPEAAAATSPAPEAAPSPAPTKAGGNRKMLL